MDRKQGIMQDLVEKGALCYVFDPDLSEPVRFLLGGVFPVKANWIVYYPAFPDEPQHLHDSLYTQFSEIPGGIEFKDQFGREVHFTELESYDKELKTIHKQWLKALATDPRQKGSLESELQERLKNPENFLAGLGAQE